MLNVKKYTPPDKCHILGIDGLRAIAVLSVIIFHLDSVLLRGGFVGVDVFFVISGFVISRSLEQRNIEGFYHYLLNFYKRRIIRIFPALIACLAICIVFSIVFIPDGWLSAPNDRTALWSFFGVSNFYLVGTADGYFSDRVEFNPFVHTWSLAVEEQFYVVFPIIFYLWLRMRVNRSYLQLYAVAFLFLLAVASLYISSVETRAAHERAFYLLPSRFWELASGALLFQLHKYFPEYFEHRFPNGWGASIGAVLLVIGFFFTDDASFPFPWVSLPVIGSLFLISSSLGSRGGKSIILRVLTSSFLTYIGKISYSLYLWHWPIFTFFRWTIGLETKASWGGALFCTYVASILSYKFVEKKFVENSYLRNQDAWKVVCGGVGAIIFAFLAAGALFYYQFSIGLNLSTTSIDKCTWSPYKSAECGLEKVSSRDIRRQVFVIGDSHAKAYEAMGSIVSKKVGAKVWYRSRPGCSIAKMISTAEQTPNCLDYIDDTLNWMSELVKPGDIVFLASLRVERFGDQWGLYDQKEVLALSKTAEQIDIRKRALIEAEDLVVRLQKLGLHVLFDAPKPIFKAPPFRCSDWFNSKNPICKPGFVVERDILLKHRKKIMDSLEKMQNNLGIFVWDPFPILCPEAECSAFSDNKPVFSDGDHLSGYGNRMLVASFEEKLLEIWKN